MELEDKMPVSESENQRKHRLDMKEVSLARLNGIYFNVRSLRNRLEEMKALIGMWGYETWMKDG